MLKIWPCEEFNLHIPKPKEVVIEILRLNTEPVKKVPSLFEHIYPKHIYSKKHFYGNIREDKFEVVPIVWYINSFLPIISGIIENQGNETAVNICMQMWKLTTAFMKIWFSGILLILIIDIICGNPLELFVLGPVTMVFFGYALMLLSFKHDANKSKKRLAEIFDLPQIP